MSSGSSPRPRAYAQPSSPARACVAGFTIIELLVVISIVALLIGILLPAIQKSRDSAKVTESLTHLRNLGVAHQSYAAEWNDRQFTLTRDDLASYGSLAQFTTAVDVHPPIILGWGAQGSSGSQILYTYYFDAPPLNESLVWPLNPTKRFGWFRIPNAKQFNQYLSGRFYDPTWFAAKDKAVLEAVEPAFQIAGEYAAGSSFGSSGTLWSSYCLSPAALFAPKVLDATHPSLASGTPQSMGQMPGAAFRVPSISQARHPSLKTHMCEHHWLQGNRGLTCNPFFGWEDGTYNGCEPYYFNHSYESAPACLFFDSSVRTMSVREAGSGDKQARANGGSGLYFRPDEPTHPLPGGSKLATDGYFLEAGYDFSTEAGSGPNQYATGFHILTKDGILGRDTLGSP